MEDALDRPPPDEVRDELDELTQSLVRRFGDGVSVDVSETAGFRMTSVTPASATACPVSWTDTGVELIVAAGKQGGRWELPRDIASVGLIKRIVDAVTSGRAEERIRGRSARLTVYLADGSHQRTSVTDWTSRGGHFWRRAPREDLDYDPYGGSA